MIKPQELRIGNFVEVENYKTIQLENIHPKGTTKVNEQYLISMLKPIELTEDWLKKFGFEAERSTVYLKLKYSTNVSDYVLYDRETKELLFIKDNQSWLCKQEYVHRLQNLTFALTGEELKIKL